MGINENVYELRERIADLHAPYLLQVLVLGALLANKELRKTVDLEDFCDFTIRAAVAELQSALVKTPTGGKFLRECLWNCGVDWDDGPPKPGDPLGKKPLVRVFERLRLDGQTKRVLDHFAGSIETNMSWNCPGDKQKAAFVRDMLDLAKTLKVDESKLPAVSAAEPPKEPEET